MDTKTGRVFNLTEEELKRFVETERVLVGRGRVRAINPNNLSARHRRVLDATGEVHVSKNTPCPCGSRKRFKNCCRAKG